MSAFVFNVAKGAVTRFAELPNANDSLVAVVLQASGLPSDATLRDLDTLAAILASATEASFSGYARQTLTGVTVTVDDTNDRVDVDCADPSWNSASGQAVAKVVLCYDPDATGGTDADLVPMFADDFVLTTPTAGTVSYAVNAAGFYRAS